MGEPAGGGWLIGEGSSHVLTGYKEKFYEYHDFLRVPTRTERPRNEKSNGGFSRMTGWGKIRTKIYTGEDDKLRIFTIKGYQAASSASSKSMKDFGVLKHIAGAPPQSFEKDEVGPAYRDVNLIQPLEIIDMPIFDMPIGASYCAVSSYGIHRRLEHAGKPK
jgi:hypothetical protein